MLLLDIKSFDYQLLDNVVQDALDDEYLGHILVLSSCDVHADLFEYIHNWSFRVSRLVK